MTEMREGEKIKIENVKALTRDCVRIRDRDRVESIINLLVEGGKDKLQVISDFDQTLTKQHCNGKRSMSSFGIFGECKQLPPSYKEKSQALYKQYKPIEIDPSLSKEQKIPFMIEWWDKAQMLLSGFEFCCDEIDQVLQEVCPDLRTGSEEMFRSLMEADVPVLVFSAGVGDMVRAILRHHKVLHPNVHIISNFLDFKGSMLQGFKGSKGQHIHTFNKNEHAIENSEYFKLITGRNNVILMGDVVGDADMAEGVKDANAVLKIGFLYDQVEENLDSYLDHFDVVLVDDQTMDVTNGLLSLIL
ncbi:7-methylguanosine phosphate-specific 5'-nucleotidase [Anabrus simplex]|uniref:7-methylguanosine phosphate-specific 5'-nucleotidase n=1 Tax=Anabrus simplex TaxID=316456 RepID=UPI0035A35F9F